MKNSSQQTAPKGKKTKARSANHSFHGLREALLAPEPGGSPGTTAAPIGQTVANVQYNNAWVLAPLGLTSTQLGASSYTRGSPGNVCGPPLRGLYNRAVDFQWYRVTRAKLVFVGSVSSTIAGTIALAGYSDPFDVTNITLSATVSGPSTRTFDAASASTKELSVPVPVDSSWKKCSSILTIPGDVYPFTGANPGSIAVVNTVSDLAFGAVSIAWQTDAPANTNLGRIFLDYDVEFRGPIDASINA